LSIHILSIRSYPVVKPFCGLDIMLLCFLRFSQWLWVVLGKIAV